MYWIKASVLVTPRFIRELTVPSVLIIVKLAKDASAICNLDEGEVVPIPILPLFEINKASLTTCVPKERLAPPVPYIVLRLILFGDPQISNLGRVV